MSEIIQVSSVSQFNDLIKGNKTVIADFYADWCGPCRQLFPMIQEKTKNSDCIIAKIDVDEEELADLTEEYKVEGIPRVFMFKGGKAVDEFVGNKEEEVHRFFKSL